MCIYLIHKHLAIYETDQAIEHLRNLLEYNKIHSVQIHSLFEISV